jgi:MFS family permease
MKIGLIFTLILAAVSVIVLQKYFKETAEAAKDELSIRGVWRKLDPNLKRLLVSDILARWAEGIPKVFIVLYVMNVLKQDAFAFGWLTAIATITSIIFYLPVSKISDRWNRRPFILATFIFFALFPLSMTFASGFWTLAAAFVFAGLREFGETSRKAMIVDLAIESMRGRAVGVYYLVRGLAVFPASLAGGLLWKMNVNLPFYIAFIAGMAGVLFYAVSSRRQES